MNKIEENILINKRLNLNMCLAFIFMCFASAWAQDKNTLSSALKGREGQQDTSKQNSIWLDRSKLKGNPPLYVFIADGKRLQVPGTDSLEVMEILKNSKDHDWIQSVNSLKTAKEMNNYGVFGQHGVLLIDLKKGTLAKLPDTLRGRFKKD